MLRKVIFQEFHVIGGDIIQLIPFICAFYAFESFMFYSHCNCKGDVTIIPSTMGTHQGDLLRRALFDLTHFRALHSIVNHFPSCLFPSIIDDTHIISPLSIISSTYEHFYIEFYVIGLSIQPQRCVTSPPSSLPPNFNIPSLFTTPFEKIRVLGVSLGTLTFTSSFIKYALLEDVRHVDLLLKMGDVQMAFGILTHCFVQHPLYFLWCTPPSSIFTKSHISFDSYLFQMFGHLLSLRSFDNPKRFFVHKQASLPITFNGIGLISTSTISPQ